MFFRTPNTRTTRLSQFDSLGKGEWVKLICGASNQDVPLIRNLCYIYTASGVDCIDMSADRSVVAAADHGITKAMYDYNLHTKPIIMISVNDDADPHFRKASFDPVLCPSDCPRPCERICPALAIPSLSNLRRSDEGVLQEKCYGCGRCFTVCPLGLINEKAYTVQSSDIEALFQLELVSAIEIHTQPGHERKFQELWEKMGTVVTTKADVIAVSFPDMKRNTASYLTSIQTIISATPLFSNYRGMQIWQADGRPMSGDIGKGSTHATCELAMNMLNDFEDHEVIDFTSGKHFIQLAGGANDYSATVAKNMNLSNRQGFGGYGFGGFARKKMNEALSGLEVMFPGAQIEDYPDILEHCMQVSSSLISTVKRL